MPGERGSDGASDDDGRRGAGAGRVRGCAAAETAAGRCAGGGRLPGRCAGTPGVAVRRGRLARRQGGGAAGARRRECMGAVRHRARGRNGWVQRARLNSEKRILTESWSKNESHAIT